MAHRPLAVAACRESLAADGGQSFVAGPTLWTDLFGRWIAGSQGDTTFGLADRTLLQASLRSLRSGRYRFLVIHFSSTDAAAHCFGTDSPEYRQAARWCDDALAEIQQALTASDRLVLTSDHGNTRRGGYAGLEPDVLATPLVIISPLEEVELPPVILQTDVTNLLRALLALEPTAVATENGALPSDSAFLRGEPGTVWWRTLWTGVLAVLIGPAATVGVAAIREDICWGWLLLLGGVALGLGRLVDGYAALDGGAVIVVAGLAGGVFCFAFLAATAAGRAWNQFSERPRLVMLGLGGLSADTLGSIALLAVFAVAILSGMAFGRLLSENARAGRTGLASGLSRWRCVVAGGLLSILQSVLARMQGETVSLSTLDVRSAFHVVELPGRVVWAAGLMTLAQALPTAGLLFGCHPAATRLGAPQMGQLCMGVYAVVAGQLGAGAVALSLSVSAGRLSDGWSPLDSLAIGALLRALAESAYLFLGLAIVLLSRSLLDRLDRWGRRGGLNAATRVRPRPFRKEVVQF